MNLHIVLHFYVEGNDYTGINVTVTISAGERRCITIDIVDDLIAERTERFRIELERYTQSGSPSSFPSTTHDIYIIDNDGNVNLLPCNRPMGYYTSLCTCTAPTLEMPFDPTFLYEYSEADVTVYEDTGSVDICVLGRAAAVPVLLGISDYYCGMEYSDSACGKCAPGISIIAKCVQFTEHYRGASGIHRASSALLHRFFCLLHRWQ